MHCDNMIAADDATMCFLPIFQREIEGSQGSFESRKFEGSFEIRMNLHHTVWIIADQDGYGVQKCSEQCSFNPQLAKMF